MVASQAAVTNQESAWRRLRLAVVGLAAVVVFACLGAGAVAGERVSNAKPVLRIGLPSGLVAGDPRVGSNSADNTIRTLAYASLFKTTGSGKVVGELVNSWRYLHVPNRKANKDFEFTLRHDARFSDGTPVTASAVANWLAAYASAPTGTSFGPKPVFNATGKWTVQMHLTVPNPEIPFFLSSRVYYWGMIVSPKAVADSSLLATGSAGAGPYMIDPSQSVVNDHYTFVPNPYYYDKASVKYSKVYVQIVPDPASMLQALQAGQIDIAVGQSSTSAAAAAAGFTVFSSPSSSNNTSYIDLADRKGTLAPALADVRVRQALNYAIDRRAIARVTLGAQSTPTSEMITTDGYDAKFRDYYPYNVQKAKSLLAAAGHPNGFTLKVASIWPANAPNPPIVLQAVAKYWDAIGVHVEIYTPPTPADYVAKVSGRNFPAYQHGQGGPMLGLYLLLMHPTLGTILNPFHIDDPTIDKLYYSALTAKDPAPYWKKMTAQLVTQAWVVPVGTISSFYYVSKHVGGVKQAYYMSVSDAAQWYPR
jgi:peptide/nickel transport system substrate-binding protein